MNRYNPLKFASTEDESAFYQYYCVDNIAITRISAFIAGVFLYVFFIWDRIVDPINWEATQTIRGLIITPFIWVSALILFNKKMEKFTEPFILFVVSITIIFLMLICLKLQHSFDYGEPGFIIILFFVAIFLPMRFSFYVALFAFGWAAACATQIYSRDYKTGMLLSNNLYSGSAIFLALFSAYVREKAARRQFVSNRELEVSKKQLDDLLQAILPSEEITWLKERRLKHVKTRVAISYRRSDSEALVGRMRDRLVNHYGADSVFVDIDNIPVGTDFRSHIATALQQASILIVVVGPNWLGTNDKGSRICDLSDPVRVELELALQSKMVVIPVLSNGASMPLEESLPDSLRLFAFRNGTEVHSGRDFNHHMERLIRAIDVIAETALT